MTRPLSPLDRSGRRPSAGPGPQSGHQPLPASPVLILIVICVAAALMLGPAIVAVWTLIPAGRFDGPDLQPLLNVSPILLSGRILVTLALATTAMRVRELE